MGLIWSMRTEECDDDEVNCDQLLIEVVQAADVVASCVVDRRRIPPGLTRAVVPSPRVGALWYPGSDTIRRRVSSCSAARRAACTVTTPLCWPPTVSPSSRWRTTDLPGLPRALVDIPLEYFAAALEFVGHHPAVRAGDVAVMGGSKGGEAALLVGASLPGVSAVVSVLGSGVVTQGITGDVRTGSFLDILSTPVAGWTWHGREVPYLPNVVTPELERAVAAGEPITLKAAFTPGLAMTERLAAATIPVERIRGPILLVSAEDDQGYGRSFHDIAADRLVEHPHVWEHVVHHGAGHGIISPPVHARNRHPSARAWCHVRTGRERGGQRPSESGDVAPVHSHCCRSTWGPPKSPYLFPPGAMRRKKTSHPRGVYDHRCTHARPAARGTSGRTSAPAPVEKVHAW